MKGTIRTASVSHHVARLGSLCLGLFLISAPHAAEIRFEGESGAGFGQPRGTMGIPPESLSGEGCLVADREGQAWSYEFQVPEAGDYTLWVRGYERTYSGRVRWRIGRPQQPGDWHVLPADGGLPERPSLGIGGSWSFTWSQWGTTGLVPGRHRLDMEYLRRSGGKDRPFAVDCILLTTEPFSPYRAQQEFLRSRLEEKQVPVPDGWHLLPVSLDSLEPSILDDLFPERPLAAQDRLLRRGKDFVTADGRSVRLWGLSGPPCPEKPDADYLAGRFRRLGVNLVRMHTLDSELIDHDADRTDQLRPDLMDRFCYFVHRLNQNGIYVQLDALYAWYQSPKEGDGIPDYQKIRPRVRMSWFHDMELQARYRDFLRRLLTFTNPYTGQPVGAGPNVALLTVVNENGVFFWTADQLTEPAAKARLEAWNGWLRERYPDRKALAQSWGKARNAEEDPWRNTARRLTIRELIVEAPGRPELHARARDQATFDEWTQTRFFEGVRSFVRDDLGFPLLVNGSGWRGIGWLDALDERSNSRMDWIARHAYWDHSQGGWGPKALYHNRWLLANLAETSEEPKGNFLTGGAGRRPEGIPFVYEEWHIGGSNDHRIEEAPLMASVAALQGWAGSILYRLDFPDLDEPTSHGTWPLLATHPFSALAFRSPRLRAGALVCRRVHADIATPRKLPSPQQDLAVDNPVEQALLAEDGAGMPGVLSLVGRCANSYEPGASAMREAVPGGSVVAANTGESRWIANAPRYEWHAPGLQGFVGASGGEDLAFPGCRIRFETSYGLIAIVPVDGGSIETSNRLFVTFVNDFKGHNRGTWQDTDQTDKVTGLPLKRLPSPGNLPILMREGAAALRFAVPIRQAWALDAGGRRTKTIAVAAMELQLRTSDGLWFELSRHTLREP